MGVLRFAILTASNRAAAGIYEDRSGQALQETLRQAFDEVEIRAYRVLPDDRAAIAEQLRAWADSDEIDVILTTGGTGFAPLDVTPEATRDVIEREAPGLAEAMRAASIAISPHGMLSRAVCGIRGKVLIVNLPGSPKGAVENLRVILPALPHAVALLRSDPNAEAGHIHPATRAV